MFTQILANIIFTSSVYLISSISVDLSFRSSKSFNLAQAALISLAAYFTYLFFVKLHLPFFISILMAIFFSMAVSVICELSVYRHMRGKNLSAFKLLIASLGLYTVLQNLISIFFGNETKSIQTGEVKAGHQILSAYITDIQIFTIAVSAVLFVAVLLLLHKTKLGRQIRAVSDNPELCNVYGINSNSIILRTSAISAALIAIVGILIVLDVDITPTFGFNYFLYGVVAMIIGGSYRGLVFGSLLLATAQHLAAYFIDTIWMDAVAYLILILFLAWKPLGFKGQRLKKVEV